MTTEPTYKIIGITSDWQDAPPPNEQVVEVEHEGQIIRVMAFYGRDGYRPHWRSVDSNTHYAVSTFKRWRKVKPAIPDGCEPIPLTDDQRARLTVPVEKLPGSGVFEPSNNLTTEQVFINQQKERIAELEAENKRLRAALKGGE